MTLAQFITIIIGPRHGFFYVSLLPAGGVGVISVIKSDNIYVFFSIATGPNGTKFINR